MQEDQINSNKKKETREISRRNNRREIRKVSQSTNITRLVCLHLFAVSEPRMGHRHAGSQEPDQSNADGQPEQKDHRQRGIEAPMDLRK